MVFAYAREDPLKLEEVFGTRVTQFLFWTEFMLLKRRAENVRA